MNMVGLRRTVKKGWVCAAVAAFAGLAVLPASAEVTNPNLVPADSAYIVSIPNSQAFWTAWEGNGLYEAFNKVMAIDDVQQKTADVKQQLSIIESSLGFKIDGATLSQIFSTVELYASPGAGGEMNGAAILTVADDDKTSKLLDLAEKAAAKSAEADDDTSTGTETASDDSATSVVAEADYNGVKIKTFKDDEGAVKFAYARTGKFLVMSAREDSLKQVIDRVKAESPAAGTLAGSEDYKKVQEALAAEKGEMYFYSDSSAANKGGNMDGVPASVRGPLQALVNSMQPTKFAGASVKISPKEIYTYSYGVLKDNSEDTIAVKNPGDQPLRIASYIPENTIWGVATSLLDAPAISELASSAASSSEQGEQISSQVQSAEAGLGFSMKNDLVPAVGNELAFALNNVQMSGLIPSVDGTIIVGVKDKAKMTKVVEGVERLGTNMLAARSGDGETSGPAIKSEEVNGQTVKYVELQGLATFSPGYVLTDNYLIIGSTRTALSGALKANADGKNLVDGNALKRLGHGIDARGNVIQYLDIAKIMEIAKQVTQMIPAAREAGKYIDAVNVIDATGANSRVENGALVSRGVLKLK